jgi:peroxisomal coenzyme A diphosphatase NUDT7
VTPLLALLDDVSVMEGLCAALSEVPHLFDLLPETLLDPELATKEILVPSGNEDWLCCTRRK